MPNTTKEKHLALLKRSLKEETVIYESWRKEVTRQERKALESGETNTEQSEAHYARAKAMMIECENMLARMINLNSHINTLVNNCQDPNT